MRGLYFNWNDGPVDFLLIPDDPQVSDDIRIYRWYDEETIGNDVRVYYGDLLPWEIEAGIPPKRVLETDITDWGTL